MAWLQIDWQLTIEKSNDYDDEPGLRFAIIMIREGTVHVHDHSTGELLRTGDRSPGAQGDVWSGRIRSTQDIPDEENPYFALAVQAFEHDGSTAHERRLDDKAFCDSLEIVCQEIVDSGGTPHAASLSAASNAPRLIRRRHDSDDWIGASTWVDVDYGRRIAANVALEHRYQTGEIIDSTSAPERQVMRFPYGDAVYELEWERRVVAGPILAESSQFSMQGWCNASWVR